MAVMGHVGQLDGASHPFTSESSVAAAELGDAVRPALEKLEKDLGFREVRGFSEGSLELKLPALLSWEATIAQHEKAGRQALANRKMLIASALKKNRQGASDWVDQEVEKVDPRLRELFGLVNARPPHRIPEPLRNLDFPDSEVLRVLDLSEEHHRGNDALRIATHNYLSSTIRKAILKAGLHAIDIGVISLRAQTDLSEILPNNCLATEQIESARRHLRELARIGTSIEPQALRAMSLILYDQTLAPGEVAYISGLSAPAVTTSRELACVAIDVPGRRGPATLTGLSALAISSLTLRKPPMNVDALSRALASLLPQELVPANRETTLALLCETAAAAARIEIPGIVRFACTAEGSLDAPIPHLVAHFRYSCPIAASALLTDPVDLDGYQRICDQRSEINTDSTLQRDSKSYRRLLRTISQPQEVCAATAAKPRKAIQARPTLELVGRALEIAYPKVSAGQPIHVVDALAAFAADMVKCGTRLKANPAVNTIRTYVSAVGHQLVDVFTGFDLTKLTADDFTDAYELVLAARMGPRFRMRLRMLLVDWHRALVAEFGVPDVELPWVPGDDGDSRPAPVLLTERQYRLALEWLASQHSADKLHLLSECGWRRASAAASVALILLFRAGLRISECALLRISDLVMIGDRIFVIVRPSVFRALKTGAARRWIDLTDRLVPVERDIILSWLKGESRRQLKLDSLALLLSEIEDIRLPIGARRLREILQASFRMGAGIDMWPHLMRHRWVSIEMHEAAIGNATHRMQSCPLDSRVRRFEAVRTQAGHVRLRTGAIHYLHLAGHLKTLGREIVADQWILSALSEQSRDNVIKIRRRHTNNQIALSSELQRRAKHQCEINTTLDPVSSESPFRARFPGLTPRQLDEILRLARGDGDVDAAGAIYGLSPATTKVISSAVLGLASEPPFYRLLSIHLEQRKMNGAKLPKHRDSTVYRNLLEESSFLSAARLAHLFETTYTPWHAREDNFRGTPARMRRMAARLHRYGAGIAMSDADKMGFSVRGQFDAVSRALAVLRVWTLAASALSKQVAAP